MLLRRYFPASLALWQQIAILLAMMTFVLAITMSWVSNSIQQKQARQQVESQNIRAVSYLSAGVLDALIVEDTPVLDSILEQALLADPTLVCLELFDEKGKSISHAESPLFGQATEKATFAKEITLEGETFGRIRLAWNMDMIKGGINEQVRQIQYQIVLMVVLVSILLFWVIRFSVLRPMGKINKQLLEISEKSPHTVEDIKPLSMDQFTASELKNMADTINSLQQLHLLQKAYQEDLKQAKKQAEESDKAKGKFLATVSHEIRTPINGIMGMAEMMLDENLNSRQSRFMKVIAQSSESLMGIVDEILDFAKIEHHTLRLKKSTFEVDKLAQDIATVYAIRMKEKGLDFRTTFNGLDDLKLEGDVGYLRQVVHNLLENALKFTAKGHVHFLMQAHKVSDQMAHINVSIKDSGIGISADDQKKIFQEFSQCDEGLSRKFGGLGLGLAISQRILHMMGGEIILDSTPGQGSCFCFSIKLPISHQPDLPKRKTAYRPVVIERTNKQKKSTILLVEDSETNQAVVKAMLEKSRYHLKIVDNGKQAYELLSGKETDHFAAVLMDISTPEMDGMTATRKIRNLAGHMADIPIIAFTAHAFTKEQDLFASSGMDDFLAKPVRRDQLLMTLDQWVPQLH